jgi:hypothetical protein
LSRKLNRVENATPTRKKKLASRGACQSNRDRRRNGMISLPPYDPNRQPWPPPKSVQPALRAARRRYQVASPVSRPALTQPKNCLVLFSLGELIALAKARYWPLPGPVLAWITEPPRSRRRRRRRWIARVEEIVRRVMVEDLPATFRLLMGDRRNGQSESGR